MANNRSFKDYVADRFYNDLFSAIQSYTTDSYNGLDLRLYKVRAIGGIEVSEIEVKFVSVNDLPDMKIGFDVVIEAELEVREIDHHYDESENCRQWFMLECSGDLDCNLDDFAISNINEYSNKNKQSKPMSDSLVPIIYKEKLEDVAMDFLSRHYPEALKTPMPIEPKILAGKMELKVKVRDITKEFSIFGQIYFDDCDTKFYDKDSDEMVQTSVEAKTIFVDPKAYFLRNLGAVNNTIVHECVHWDLHRKAFALEQLYNSSASRIKCQVIGGIKDNDRDATDWMEWQANALAPRIQMPLAMFKTKASEFIKQYRAEMHTFELVDVMQPVIDALAIFFGVSRTAAKIRMVDAGYDEAIGVFNYVDGRYVRPHRFKKDAITKEQTYTISAIDAMLESIINPELGAMVQSGSYLFVESHLCLNDPKYITTDDDGEPCLTNYGRLHLDECCVAFNLKIKTTNKYGEKYYTDCVLYRDTDLGLVFEAQFAPEKSVNVQKKAAAIAEHNKEIMDVIKKLPSNFAIALKELMKWSNSTVEALAEKSLLSTKTIQRMRNEDDYQTTFGTIVALCVAMQLPPILSMQLIEIAGFAFRFSSQEQMMYHFIITGYYTHSIYECNELLTTNGFKELTASE